MAPARWKDSNCQHDFQITNRRRPITHFSNTTDGYRERLQAEHYREQCQTDGYREQLQTEGYRARLQTAAQSLRTFYEDEKNVHDEYEELIEKLHYHERALQHNHAECEKWKNMVKVKNASISELHAAAATQRENASAAQKLLEKNVEEKDTKISELVAAAAIERENGRVAQQLLREENESLRRELEGAKARVDAGKEAKAQLEKIRSLWTWMSEVAGVRGDTMGNAKDAEEEVLPFDLGG